MALTLDALALQGDPGTLQTDQQAAKLKLMNPQQLYLLWERQHWASQEIDLPRTRRTGWSWTTQEEEQAIWGMAAFFIGEERVTTQFSGLVMSYDDEDEASFLATQQVDEARHMQFFDRFHREVMGSTSRPAPLAGRDARHVNDAFITLFDEELVDAEREAGRRPARHRGQGRLRHHLPHGDRGHARAHRARTS